MIGGFASLFGLWIVLPKDKVLDVSFLEVVVEDSSSGEITSWILVRANKVCVEHRVDVEGVREFEGEV